MAKYLLSYDEQDVKNGNLDVSPDGVLKGGLPSGQAANQQLVTDDDALPRWENRIGGYVDYDWLVPVQDVAFDADGNGVIKNAKYIVPGTVFQYDGYSVVVDDTIYELSTGGSGTSYRFAVEGGLWLYFGDMGITSNNPYPNGGLILSCQKQEFANSVHRIGIRSKTPIPISIPSQFLTPQFYSPGAHWTGIKLLDAVIDFSKPLNPTDAAAGYYEDTIEFPFYDDMYESYTVIFDGEQYRSQMAKQGNDGIDFSDCPYVLDRNFIIASTPGEHHLIVYVNYSYEKFSTDDFLPTNLVKNEDYQVILTSCTAGSKKKFRIQVDDSGALTTEEVTE